MQTAWAMRRILTKICQVERGLQVIFYNGKKKAACTAMDVQAALPFEVVKYLRNVKMLQGNQAIHIEST
ncbi:hypothetical protein PAEVO_59380 [Paenibacillus sp. GM2FR]|nr:hypothetical protein PAEVO_59380 [Paenibacillus sp. GM2FR]